MTGVSIAVPGVPVPQGGMKAVPVGGGRTRLISSGGKGLLAWRRDVAAAAAAEAKRVGTIEGAVGVQIWFKLPMPKSRPASIRKLGETPKTTKPDADKLTRAVLDSLTASGLIEDDARVASLAVRKTEVWNGWTGALIRVEALI